MHRPDSGDRRHAHAGAPGQELLCRSSIGPPRSSELATLSRQLSGAILVVERRVAESTLCVRRNSHCRRRRPASRCRVQLAPPQRVIAAGVAADQGRRPVGNRDQPYSRPFSLGSRARGVETAAPKGTPTGLSAARSELATLSRQLSGATLVVKRRVAETTSAPSCARATCINPAYSRRWALIYQTGDIAR